MSHSFGLVIESLVAVLLLLTIGYCMLLNRRLKRLRADEQSMRGMIAELITATEIAERAIGGLKVTVRECDENLGRPAHRWNGAVRKAQQAGDGRRSGSQPLDTDRARGAAVHA